MEPRKSLHRRGSIKQATQEVSRAARLASDAYHKVVVKLLLRDVEDQEKRENLVVCQATVVFLAVVGGFIAIMIQSLIRLSGSSVSLEVVTTTYRGTHLLPRVCVEIDSSTTEAVFLWRTIYDQYNGGETDVTLNSSEITLDVNQGVTVDVVCAEPPYGAEAIAIQGAFEDSVYTFVTVKIYSTAANVSVVEDGFSNIWTQNYPLPFDINSDAWISFHQTFGAWMAPRMELFFDYTTVSIIDKLTLPNGNYAVSIFHRSEFRAEHPIENVTTDDILAFYLRSNLLQNDVTQRAYSVIDAGSSMGGMWSLFLLVASWWFFMFFTARRTHVPELVNKTVRELSVHSSARSASRSVGRAASESARTASKARSKAHTSFDNDPENAYGDDVELDKSPAESKEETAVIGGGYEAAYDGPQRVTEDNPPGY